MTRIAPYLLFIGTFCLVLIEGLLLLIHFFQCSISGIIDNHSHCIIPRRVRWDLLHQAKQKRILLTIMRNTWLVNTFFSQTRIKLCHFTQWSLTPFIVTQVWAPCYWASNSVNSVCLLQSYSPGSYYACSARMTKNEWNASNTICDHMCLDLLSLVIELQVSWLSTTWNLGKEECLRKRVLTFDHCRPYFITFGYF